MKRRKLKEKYEKKYETLVSWNKVFRGVFGKYLH